MKTSVYFKYLALLVVLLTSAGCFLFEKEEVPDRFDQAETVAASGEGSNAGVVAGQVVQGVKDLDYEEKVVTQGQIIRHQERELNLQQKELEHLQRQEYYNKALEKYQKQ